ncbi:hypothetical protein H1P_6600007 [Hyella patelloides LEGE 07179]|uniref:Uncharacterized protein n=1 Tax=Hyella patelloides LEGE 07179 TaxID=945734 RepID=A0A563W334_9CYAN|nr:hypothetical protein H1P_6600007 [Hyella patelloides LEGE 07179]
MVDFLPTLTGYKLIDNGVAILLNIFYKFFFSNSKISVFHF